MNWEKSTVEALESLLTALRLPDDMSLHSQLLQERLNDVTGPRRLHSALRGLVDLVVEMRLREQAERQELSEFLERLREQLETLEKALMVTEQQSSTSFQIGRKEEQALERQVDEIESRMRTATTAEQVRFMAQQRLAIIRARLDDNRGKQASQFAALQGQLGKLGQAMRQLEQESQIQRNRLEGKPCPPLVDAATGAANRDAFELRLHQEYSRWRRYGMPLALMMITIGRGLEAAGSTEPSALDEVFQQLAARLTGNLRETDFLCRYGTTQFAILMPGIDLEEARAAAIRLSAEVVAAPVTLNDQEMTVSVSIGLSTLQPGDDTASLLMRAFTPLADLPALSPEHIPN
jgi:diguanylate cyclase